MSSEYPKTFPTATLADRACMLTPDGWDAPTLLRWVGEGAVRCDPRPIAAFFSSLLAGGWFRQNGVASSHPPAGNAHPWAAVLKCSTDHTLWKIISGKISTVS